mmetsp:Transcript_70684/g.199581  ORF Transcript_70684/g.199581 Transcript_70684/m.199581 type:complete len:274 (+) Transcript_70684:1345-2166(+)
MVMPRSSRREACTNLTAERSFDTASCAISVSALKRSGMCCKAAPHRLTTSSAKPRSWRKTGSAWPYAAGSISVASMISLRSLSSSGCAPPRAAPRPSCASSRKNPRSSRRVVEDLLYAEALIWTARNTKSRSLRSSGAAYCRDSPLHDTAWRTMSPSAWSSLAAWASATPALSAIAPSTRSRSDETSTGASAKSLQSARMAARQAAWRQLLTSTAGSPVSSETPASKISWFFAAMIMPFIITMVREKSPAVLCAALANASSSIVASSSAMSFL